MSASRLETTPVTMGARVEKLDVDTVRRDFPILDLKPYGKPLVYLDNAASSQKPRQVIDTLREYYQTQHANVHRGIHYLSELATKRYEDARVKVQKFINAAESREIIFTRGTTEGINLVASSYGRKHVGKGDEVIISHMEHHSNIVPWQLLCEERGAILKVIPIDDRGELRLEAVEDLMGPKTRIVAIGHVSNALGTVNPIGEIIAKAHSAGVPVVVDGAQAVPHMAIDVKALDCDFYAFSGHKMFGPTGIGVLYGKAALLEEMPPYQGGGEMILQVSFERTTYNKIPHKFEAGTPNIADAIGLGAAVDYLSEIGFDRITAYENELLAYGSEALATVPGLRMIGTARKKAAVLSFVLDRGIHPHDIGQILSDEGVAIRAGHHCAQPVMQHFGIPATARASLAMYNTRDEIGALVRALHKVREVFA